MLPCQSNYFIFFTSPALLDSLRRAYQRATVGGHGCDFLAIVTLKTVPSEPCFRLADFCARRFLWLGIWREACSYSSGMQFCIAADVR